MAVVWRLACFHFKFKLIFVDYQCEVILIFFAKHDRNAICIQGVSKHETKHLGEVFAEQKQKHLQIYTGMIYLTFANIQLFAVNIADEKQKIVLNVFKRQMSNTYNFDQIKPEFQYK